VNRAQIEQRVASFPNWHYEFDLGGVRTPITPPGHAVRHQERKRYFFEPLVRLAGGTLAGKRVLDLGCNAGFWSLAAIEAGADYVFGVDGRQMHVDQARFVFEVKEIEPSRHRFERADIFELDLGEERFDIVLCLGVLYHVSKPFELMDKITRCNDDLLVIDTTLDVAVPGAYFRMSRENLESPRNAVDAPVALYPTRLAVLRLAELAGYRAVTLKPQFKRWKGSGGYRDGRRRAFLCAKRTSLDALDSEPAVEREPDEPPSSRGTALSRSVRRAAGRGTAARRRSG
jgi:SAM-dependent methyltransferase